MKTKKSIKAFIAIALCLFMTTGLFAQHSARHTSTIPTPVPVEEDEGPKIQLAILLDASNSMDGLIDQAKSRLWNIVNTLTSLKFQGQEPHIEIALYKYGNDGLKQEEHYVKQLVAFTTDLDLISEKLFGVTTYGGLEYCGAVIDHSIKNLKWSKNKNSMKLIYIAGNEPFSQGTINYIEAISGAKSKDVFVNTIYCGNCEYGVQELWKDGADKGDGKYFCINSDEKVRYIVTPYDDDLIRCNEKLNSTYIYYGSYGEYGYANQAVQDQNAQQMSGANYAERAVAKSKSVYNNAAWDLVDMHQSDPEYYKTVDKKTLPEQYQKMTDAQLKAEIEKNQKERSKIQLEIAELSQKRQSYIDVKMKEEGVQDDFGAAVNSSILELAKAKGYEM